MRGSVYKRCTCPPRVGAKGRRLACTIAHGSWSFKLDLPSSPTAPRRVVTRGGFASRAEAEAELTAALARQGRGGTAVASKMRLADYLAQWLAGQIPLLGAAAHTNYAKVIELYIGPHLGTAPLAELAPLQLSAFYATLLAGGGRGGRPLSPTSVRLVHRILHKALGDAVESDLLARNPLTKVKPPKKVAPDTAVWTAEQAAQFLAACREDRMYACWLIALSCGLRRGELAGLRWRDLDLGAGTLSVNVQRTTDASTQLVEKPPKGTSRRTLDLGAQTLAALEAHRLRQARECAFVGRAEPEDGLVFTAEDGSGFRPQRITELFQQAALAAGVPVIRLHDARHSCATLALTAGIHPKVVQQLLGHASWSTTMDLYTHRVPRLQRDVGDRIEALLVDPTEPPSRLAPHLRHTDPVEGDAAGAEAHRNFTVRPLRLVRLPASK